MGGVFVGVQKYRDNNVQPADSTNNQPAVIGQNTSKTPASITQESKPQTESNKQTYLVTYNEKPDVPALAASLGVPQESLTLNEQAQTIAVESTQSQSVVEQLLQKDIPSARVEKDEPIHALTTPNDPRYTNQETTLGQIRAPQAWGYAQGKATAVIAIIDTGIDGTHADLTGKVDAGYNYISDSAISAGADSDDHGHGTEIAGIAAATGNNAVGIAGVDWNAHLMPVKVLDASGAGTTQDAVDGITYAADHGATVINMSFGRGTSSTALENALSYAQSKGVLLVGASGNDGAEGVDYPAAYENVISVGAVDSTGARASFSDYGSELDVVAPGVSIYTTSDGGGYTTASGTSVAAPFVAGLLTLEKDFHSGSTNDEIISFLYQSTQKVSGMGGNSKTNEYGNGLVDAYAMMVNYGSYSATLTNWGSSAGTGQYPSVAPGGNGANMWITVRNTGRSTWDQNIVHLGTVSPRDRIPGFLRESQTGAPSGWVTANRIGMQESSVAPGESATFSFYMAATSNKSPGTYIESFQLVADGITWIHSNVDIHWDIKVLTQAQQYSASIVSWSTSNGDYTYPTITRGGSGANITLTVRNTGTATWWRGTVNLGTDDPKDRIPGFLRESRTTSPSGWISANRVTMQESSVAPGATATYSFYLAATSDKPTGTYRERFRLVIDGITWLNDLGVYYDVTVN